MKSIAILLLISLALVHCFASTSKKHDNKLKKNPIITAEDIERSNAIWEKYPNGIESYSKPRNLIKRDDVNDRVTVTASAIRFRNIEFVGPEEAYGNDVMCL